MLAQETSLVEKQSSDQLMTNSNEIGVSEDHSSLASRSIGSGDMGGVSSPEAPRANENMNSTPVLQGLEQMGMIANGGASA
jgi:hypothetical protein